MMNQRRPVTSGLRNLLGVLIPVDVQVLLHPRDIWNSGRLASSGAIPEDSQALARLFWLINAPISLRHATSHLADSLEVFQEETETRHGQDSEVELPDKRSLLGTLQVGVRVPNVGLELEKGSKTCSRIRVIHTLVQRLRAVAMEFTKEKKPPHP